MQNHSNFCEICGRHKGLPEGDTSVCVCFGVQTYAMSSYPGEYQLVPSHPGSGDEEQWYRREDIDPLLRNLAEWKGLRDVSFQIFPGFDGMGEEADPTPASIREHLAYLQKEWDDAERRAGALERRIKEMELNQQRTQA